MAEVLFAQGRDAEGRQAAQRAVDLDPGYRSAPLNTLLMHALSVDDDDEAIRVMGLWYDADFYLQPTAEAFVTTMRDPARGRAALQA